MCDPMWHVSSRSGTLVTYLLSYSIHKCRTCIVCPLGTSYRTALPKRLNWSSAVKVADWRRPKPPCTRCDYMHTGATWWVWWTNCAAAAMHAVAVISVVTCLGLFTVLDVYTRLVVDRWKEVPVYVPLLHRRQLWSLLCFDRPVATPINNMRMLQSHYNILVSAFNVGLESMVSPRLGSAIRSLFWSRLWVPRNDLETKILVLAGRYVYAVGGKRLNILSKVTWQKMDSMWTQLKLKPGKVNDSWKLCLILSRLLREREVLAVYGAVSISQLIINHITTR